MLKSIMKFLSLTIGLMLWRLGGLKGEDAKEKVEGFLERVWLCGYGWTNGLGLHILLLLQLCFWLLLMTMRGLN